jgi:uncharacterized protein (UPF0548 family)
MFLLNKPREEVVRKFIAAQERLPFNYSEVGATETEPPPGFTVDRNRIKLGSGEHVYLCAIEALRNWNQFELGWVTIVPRHTPIEVGRVVAVQAHTFGFWSLSACRIVYVIEQGRPNRRFAFAYGTLPGHVECGEERFSIEWHEDDSVWYDIYAFSHPQHPLVKLGFPIARRLQKRFARESLAAMVKAGGNG